MKRLKPRSRPSITPALCVSLIAHGLGLSAIAWWVVVHTPAPKWPAIDKVAVLLNALPKTDLKRIVTPPPPVPKKAVPPPPEKKKPPEQKKPPVKFDKPQKDEKDDSGEADGKGTANRSTDGDKPMLANAALEQADLMKPADQFAPDAFLPSSKGELKGNDAPPQKTAAASVAQVQPVVQPPVNTAGPLPIIEPKPPTVPASETKDPQANLPIAKASTPKPVQKEIRGHKAAVSDTESIAFARQDSVTFREGKLEGRKGLRVKTSVPRLGFASEVDLQNMGRLHLVLGVTVDLDGNPQDVQILESSGSVNVDQDYKNEVYNHWNLEPKKDKDGHPIDMNWVVDIR